MNSIPNKANAQHFRLRLIFLLLIASLVLTLYFVALASLPNNPISLKSNSRFHVVSFLPEGWAFFTRDTREDMQYVYKKQADGHWELVTLPGASLRYLFGLSRKGRAIGPEITLLLRQIEDDSWTKSRMPVSIFFQHDTLKTYTISNPAPAPICTGDIILQSIPPVPWAWSGSKKEIIMPYKIVRLYVKTTNRKDGRLYRTADQ